VSASPLISSMSRGNKPAGGSSNRARGGLARGLLLVLLPLILLPLITFAVLIYRQVQADTTTQAFAQLQSLADLKKDQIGNWAAARVADISNLANAPDLKGQVRDYYSGLNDGSLVTNHLNDFLINNSQFEAIMLARPGDGVVSLSTRQARFDRFIGSTFLDSGQLNRSTTVAFLAPPFFDPRVQEVVVLVAAPVVDPSLGKTLGIVLGFVRGSQLSDVAAPVPGLGRTGHAFVITRDSYQLGSMVTNVAASSSGIDQARMQHIDGSGVYLDLNGQQVFGVYRWLPSYQLALLVEEGTTEALAPLGRFAGVLIGISVSAIAISLLGVIYFTRRITGPLQSLTESAMRMAGGDLTANVTIKRRDEVGLLADAFNSMSGELRGLYQDLESKVEARTRQLASAAEIGRAATSILGTEDLLSRSVDLIRDRFGYYHVSFFLLDETGRWAVLSEATGAVGAQLKARGYRLAVGSNSLIGWVTANRQPRIVLDVVGDAFYFPNELLPDTRSEAALPLRVGDRLLGALDVQSQSLNAFTQPDIEVLQVLADQLAVAVENGRLFARQERVAQLEQRVANLTAKIHGSITVDAILENAATELGQVFGARKVVVRLAPEDESVTAGEPLPNKPPAGRNGRSDDHGNGHSDGGHG
jgi:HAMP domain-containing protein/putative methionine-R-sulfoxide reductase with GAF domain